MYDNFKVANYSNALLSPELFGRPFSRLFSGDVIDGLTVIPSSGLIVTLQTGNTLVRYGSAAVASARIVSLVADFNLTHGTADASNPRIDLIVVYIDNGVSLPSGTPTSANLDGKGVPKAKIVAGTAASSPVVPNSTAIQASVGAGNPYTVVAQVRVDAGVTVIAGNKITDARSLSEPVRISKTAPIVVSPFNVIIGAIQISGGTVSASSGGTPFTFPRAFSAAPTVTATVQDVGATYAGVYDAPTTTGAKVRQSYGGGNLPVNWMAIGPA